LKKRKKIIKKVFNYFGRKKKVSYLCTPKTKEEKE
jgi:hypothetical protein